MVMFLTPTYPIAIAEMTLFQRQVRGFMTVSEVSELIGHIAFNPTEGDVMRDTGGIRKLRWALQGRGKSGGARIIYFFYDLNMPLYLLAAYTKSQKINLSMQERHGMRKLVRDLIRTNYASRMHHQKGETQ